MKRLAFLLALLLSMATAADAYNLTANTVEIGKARQARLYIGVDCDTEMWHAFSVDIALPKGFTMKYNAYGTPEVILTDRVNGLFSMGSNYQAAKDVWSFYLLHSTMHGVPAGTEPMVYLTVIADETVADGTYTGTIQNVVAASMDDQSVAFDNTPFTITVDHNRLETVVLDETATEAPTASDGEVDAEVHRTIQGGTWSTLCLPFAMTGDQVRAALGDDVRVADYTGWTGHYASDDDEHPSAITINFKSVAATTDGLEANHPYLVKTTADVTSFTAAAVTISPEDEPAVTTGSSRRGTLGSFIGNYVAGFTVPEATLFLADGSFWYSTGATKMKAFRGYFELYDVLQAYYDGDAGAKVGVSIDGDATAIRAIRAAETGGKVWTLGGQLVGNHGTEGLPKGVYIREGRKIIIK